MSNSYYMALVQIHYIHKRNKWNARKKKIIKCEGVEPFKGIKIIKLSKIKIKWKMVFLCFLDLKEKKEKLIKIKILVLMSFKFIMKILTFNLI